MFLTAILTQLIAFFHDDPPAQLSTPWHVRAPESLFNQPIDKYVDMWSMGCLVCVFRLLKCRREWSS